MSGTPNNFFSWIIFLLQQYHGLYFSGLITTLETSLLGTVLGCVLGFAVGVVQCSSGEDETTPAKKTLFSLLRGIVKVYVTVFRGTPMIVQAMVIFYGISEAFGVNMPAFQAAILIITLNTGAYMSETVRGGIQSIDKGQTEGALALGMNRFPMMMHIILPQTMRVIFPQIGNTFVGNIKDTSVLNVISVTELFYITNVAAGTYFRMFEAYTITAMIYLTLTLAFNLLFRIIEVTMAGRESYTVVGSVEPGVEVTA